MSKNENKLPITKHIQKKMASMKMSKCESCELSTGCQIGCKSCTWSRYGILEAGSTAVKTVYGYRVDTCPKYVPIFDYYMDDSELRAMIREKTGGRYDYYLSCNRQLCRKIWKVYVSNRKRLGIEDWEESNKLLAKVVAELVERKRKKDKAEKASKRRSQVAYTSGQRSGVAGSQDLQGLTEEEFRSESE